MLQKLKNIYHFFQAIIALLRYGFPARKMTVIGITGTDGKTTTSTIVYNILVKAGKKAALITSVSAIIDGRSFNTGFHVTTPGSFALQKYIRKARKAGVKYLVLEVSSHALDQNRVLGVPFAVGILTNITNEHLDYHKTYKNYLKAKVRLLKRADVAVVNKDDHSYQQVKKYLRFKKTITYGLKKDASVNPHSFPFRSKLMGKFNTYNALAAIAALRELKIPDDAIRSGLASINAPEGRQEIIYDKGFKVIVDFAHTPNSFRSILPEVRKETKKRIIHVFGAAAERDKYKRPEMGKISSEFADIIVLTAEDSRKEGVRKINEQIKAGVTGGRFVVIDGNDPAQEIKLIDGKRYILTVDDRRSAVEKAIAFAGHGDVVLLTGKGHEKSINYGKGEEPWDEKKVALEAIDKKLGVGN